MNSGLVPKIGASILIGRSTTLASLDKYLKMIKASGLDLCRLLVRDRDGMDKRFIEEAFRLIEDNNLTVFPSDVCVSEDDSGYQSSDEIIDIDIPQGLDAPLKFGAELWQSLSKNGKYIFINTLNKEYLYKNNVGSLLDFIGEPTSCYTELHSIISTLGDGSFDTARQVNANITILYSEESFKADPEQSEKSIAAFKKIMSDYGLAYNICEFSEYDWNRDTYKDNCIIVAGQSRVSESYYGKIRNFVKAGGKLISESCSFFYKDNDEPSFGENTFGLSDVFGGTLQNCTTVSDKAKLRIGDYKFRLSGLYGILKNEASSESVPLIKNKYGRGLVLWIPSDLASSCLTKKRTEKYFFRLVFGELANVMELGTIRFKRLRKDISISYLQTDDGVVSIVTNNRKHRCKIKFRTDLSVHALLFSNKTYDKIAKAKNRKIKLRSGQTAVVLWK